MKIGVHYNQAVSQSLRHVNQLQGKHSQLIEQLATGKRINRASDDPSGLVVLTHLESEAVKLVSKIDGLQRSNSVLATTEGGLAGIQDLLLEATSLITTLSNDAGLSDDERDAIELNLNGIAEGINRVIEVITFNGQSILQGVLSFDLTGLLEEADALNLDQVETFLADQDIHTDLIFDHEPEEIQEQGGFVPVGAAVDLTQAVQSQVQQVLEIFEQTASQDQAQSEEDELKNASDTQETKAEVNAQATAAHVADLSAALLKEIVLTASSEQVSPAQAAAIPVSLPGSPLALAEQIVENASREVSTQRAAIGIQIRENETMTRVHSIALENTLAAKSQIEDLDYAKTTGELARTEILIQTSLQALILSMREQQHVLDLLMESVKPKS